MNIEDFKKIPIGVAIVYWKAGGFSSAIVVRDCRGKRTLIPSKWFTEETHVGISEDDLGTIENIHRVTHLTDERLVEIYIPPETPEEYKLSKPKPYPSECIFTIDDLSEFLKSKDINIPPSHMEAQRSGTIIDNQSTKGGRLYKTGFPLIPVEVHPPSRNREFDGETK